MHALKLKNACKILCMKFFSLQISCYFLHFQKNTCFRANYIQLRTPLGKKRSASSKKFSKHKKGHPPP